MEFSKLIKDRYSVRKFTNKHWTCSITRYGIPSPRRKACRFSFSIQTGGRSHNIRWILTCFLGYKGCHISFSVKNHAGGLRKNLERLNKTFTLVLLGIFLDKIKFNDSKLICITLHISFFVNPSCFIILSTFSQKFSKSVIYITSWYNKCCIFRYIIQHLLYYVNSKWGDLIGILQ